MTGPAVRFRWFAGSLIALLAVGLAAGGSARAQDEAPPDDGGEAAPSEGDEAPTEAQDEHERMVDAALAEYQGGNYAEAYALFTRLHEERPTARSARVLGMTSFELRRYVEAIRWLELSLEDTRDGLSAEQRQSVEALLSRARSFVGRFTVSVDVEGAEIALDGAPIAEPTVTLDLGEHEFTARASGYESAARRVTVAGGEDLTVELSLVRLVVAQEADPGALLRDVGWASLIGGFGMSAVGAISAVIWADTVSTLNANLASGACTADPVTESVTSDTSECLDQQSRYRLALPFIYVGFITGGGLLATGVGLLVAGQNDSEAATAGSVRCGPFADVGLSCDVAF